MDNFVIIEGYVLWAIVLFLLMFVLLALIALIKAINITDRNYILEDDNKALIEENAELRQRICRLEGKLYKAGFTESLKDLEV